MKTAGLLHPTNKLLFKECVLGNKHSLDAIGVGGKKTEQNYSALSASQVECLFLFCAGRHMQYSGSLKVFPTDLVLNAH